VKEQRPGGIEPQNADPNGDNPHDSARREHQTLAFHSKGRKAWQAGTLSLPWRKH
jgi:hypothetical protein